MFPAVIAQSQEQHRNVCEKRKGLVILVEFPDIAPPVDENFVRERFKKLDSLRPVRCPTGRYALRSMSQDGAGSRNPLSGMRSLRPISDVDKSRVERLIQHAIDAADGKNDFSRYSFVVVFLGAPFKEYGIADSVDIRECSDESRRLSSERRRGRLFKEGLRSLRLRHPWHTFP